MDIDVKLLNGTRACRGRHTPDKKEEKIKTNARRNPQKSVEEFCRKYNYSLWNEDLESGCKVDKPDDKIKKTAVEISKTVADENRKLGRRRKSMKMKTGSPENSLVNGTGTDVITEMEKDDFNDSFEKMSYQVGKARAYKKQRKNSTDLSVIDCTTRDKEIESCIKPVFNEDLNLPLVSACPHKTSTPYHQSKTKERHSKKRGRRRKRNMTTFSLDFGNDTEQSSPVDKLDLKSTDSEISMLNLSLPTPRPARISPDPHSVSYDASYKEMEDSSDDEDLPVGLTPLKIEKSFSEKDIVWVKWKKWPHLPALVKKVYRKKKRLTCAVFSPTGFDADFTMGYGNPEAVIPYCDPRKEKIFAEAEKLMGTERKYFNECITEAENFQTKEALKGLGEAGLFKENLEQEKQIETRDNSEERITSSRKRKLSSENDLMISKVEKKKNGLSKQGQKRVERMSEKTKPMTDFLVSDTTKEYLRNIYSGDIQSELHKKFLSCSIRERAKMKHRGFGPIDDESQIELLLNTYLVWLRQINTQPIHEINYVFDVWVPEAVVFAFKKQKGYGKKRAWEQFNKGVRRTKEELRAFHDEIMQ